MTGQLIVICKIGGVPCFSLQRLFAQGARGHVHVSLTLKCTFPVPLEFVYSAQHARHKDGRRGRSERWEFHAYEGENWLLDVVLRRRPVFSRMAPDNLLMGSVSKHMNK